MKKKLKKSTWMPLALLVYTTAMAAYFLPKNKEISDTEKWFTHLDSPRLNIHARLLPMGDFLPVPEIGYCKDLGNLG